MEPIILAKNQYRGPNAHLLSLQQTPTPDVSLWRSFHSDYITFITATLNRCLPPNYRAVSEPSVQVRLHRSDVEPSDLPPRYPDSAVYRTPATAFVGTINATSVVADPDFVVQYTEPVSEPDIFAVVIYKAVSNRVLGDPVVRIELLSPSNKGNGRDALSYLAGRDAALQSGTLLYEIDLLHETPTLWEIPTYPDAEDSHPYYIGITNPQRSPIETWVKGFNVDDPFPLVNIPLIGEDIVRDFDFGVAYNEAFEGGRCGMDINYAELPDPQRQTIMLAERRKTVPPAINTYSPADQARIKRRMQAVIDGVKAGTIQ